jgi:DNA replication and repair protein RecF
MRLTRLSLTDFRGYPEAELHPDPALTIVAGPNGAGKTNLLEAVHVAITGRSHRSAADHELVRHGQPFARVRLDLAADDGGAPAAIELVLPGETAPDELRKRLTVNGVPRRASSVSETARSVLFRPEEMLLLIGSPAERRRFLDGILAQRDRRAARDLAELVRVLAQRNALLRAVRREEATDEGLGFWDEQLAQVGSRVMASRLRLVSELGERIPALHDAVAPPDEDDASVELTYLDTLKDAWPERPAGANDPEALVLAFRKRIAEARQKEMWNGVSLIGPQRDDLRVALRGRDVATHASRGQQRTIIVALKLAERDLLGADDAPAPIVLLDDVFSELDRDRAERTLDLLLDRGQVLVTTADLGLLPAGRRQRVPVWQVGAGELRRSPRVA